jgi:hypothetical protein
MEMLQALEIPLETVTKADIEDLLGWPENETLEFNEALPGENGTPDPWLTGGNVTKYAKREMFKEIVALANTAGGNFILGIEESDEKPPVAKSIKPIRGCVDLAERLRRSASSSIDPPIPGLNSRGIETQDDGSGIVVFRVPQSRSAPHRSSDRHCYVRRGDESVPMSMREIQDLTIHLSRRIDELNARFERLRTEFLKWLEPLGKYHGGVIGLRVTAVPVGERLFLDRVNNHANEILKVEQFRALIAGTTPIVLHPFQDGGQAPIPVFRGARREFHEDRRTTWFSASCDGVIEIRSRLRWVTSENTQSGKLTNMFYLGWILDAVANVVKAARSFANAAGVPECEYAMTLEVRCTNGATDIPLRIGYLIPGADDLGEIESPLVVEEPMSMSDRDELMNRVTRDFFDACHQQLPQPEVLKITNWN